MNILISIGTLEVGGAQTFALRLASALAEDNGNKVYFFNQSAEKQKTGLIETYLSKQVGFYSIGSNKILDLLSWKLNALFKRLGFQFSFRVFSRNLYFKWIVWKHKIAVVNSHMMLSDIEIIKQINPQIPLAISMHGCYDNFLEEDILELSKKVFERASAIIYTTSKNLKIIEHLNIEIEKKLAKIYYGFNPSNFKAKSRKDYDISDNAFVFGLVARGIPDKGWCEAIEAFKRLLEEYKQRDLHLVLVGESEFITQLKKENDLSGYRNNIHFVGHSNNPLEWIYLFNVGLLPTYFHGESLPNTIIEYLFCGVPVITTDIGEIKQMTNFEGNQSGYVLNLKDGKVNVEELAQTMQIYVERPDILNLHAENTKKVFKQFDMNKCTTAYKNLFNTLVSV
jgi:L-malate glycosyltransferase